MSHHTIKLDIDRRLDGAGRVALEKRIAFVADITDLPLRLMQLWTTQRGHHAVIFSRTRLSEIEIVALQAILGSDYKRETFNFARVRVLGDAPTFWQKRHNVLYSEKLEESQA